MRIFTTFRKKIIRTSLVLMLGLFAASIFGQSYTINVGTVTNQNPIPSSGGVIVYTDSIVIPGNSTYDYVLTGTATNARRVTVKSGYHGQITFNNLTITSSAVASGTRYGWSGYSCITIEGAYNQSNLEPVTIVDIVLQGTNVLTHSGANYSALQVNQGAQINISAIDPNDNTSGRLTATTSNSSGGAAIGAPNFQNATPGTTEGTLGQGVTNITVDASLGGVSTNCGTTGTTAGGNIIISSGTVTGNASNAHGAGIGGGFRSYYDGIIIVYGGVVSAQGGTHAAGIGSGCPNGNGVQPRCFTPLSAVIALPPAQISATTRQTVAGATALGGARSVTYIGDPQQPRITVHTVENTPNADIYLDLTETPRLVNLLDSMGINTATVTNYDLTKAKVGTTNAAGTFEFRAGFNQNTTFFTDASSINPANMGRPFMPVIRTVIGTQATNVDVSLPLLAMNIAFTDYPATALVEGYNPTQARQSAFVTKVTYSDGAPMTNVSFALQTGADFSSLIFLGPDSSSVLPLPPTTLSNGTVFYIVVPINQNKTANEYSDVLLINGRWNNTALPGPIRKVVTQPVVFEDTGYNFIKVTANPAQFRTNNASTAQSVLSLNITHGTASPYADYPYVQADVTARYLITTEPNYATALAANPLTTWSVLNAPATDGGSNNTTASFTGKPEGTYYIHWYVVSGIIYAHSTTVVSPPAQYGGFGPYILDTTAPSVVITVDGVSDTKTINSLATLPVVITFSEEILASTFTASDITITANTAGTITNLTQSGSDPKVWNATLTPSSSLANGANFTVQIAANRVTDPAGNNNTASNSVTVTFSNTVQPTISFANIQSAYASLQPSFTIAIDPSDQTINNNTDLFPTAGGTAIALNANIASYFTITPSGGGAALSNFEAIYTKQTSGGVTTGLVTFNFTGDLTNGQTYTVSVAVDKFYNLLGNGNTTGTRNFAIAYPEFPAINTNTGIFASPNQYTSPGGTTTLTIKGENLKFSSENGTLVLEVRCPTLTASPWNLPSTTTYQTGSDNLDFVTIPNVAIPANTSGAVQTHTFTLYSSYNSAPLASTAKTATVLVDPDASKIIKVENLTVSVSNLTFGYSAAATQAIGAYQQIRVTNNGLADLTGLAVTLTGTDGSRFTQNFSLSTPLAPNATNTFNVYLTTGLNAGTYGAGTNVQVTGTSANQPSQLTGTAALVTQTVTSSTTPPTGAGDVVGNPQPSASWINPSQIGLTASVQSGDAITGWKYAVTNSTTVPGSVDPSWVTVGATSTTSYTVPAGTDGTRYIHWEIVSTNYTSIKGIIENSGVNTYNLDVIQPTVTNITSTRSNFTGPSPFTITVEFSEGVTTPTSFAATNASISGITPVASSMVSAGLYTQYQATVTPNSGLTDGSIITLSVNAGVARDKATNLNTASNASTNISITYNGSRPTATITPSVSMTNTDFTVTVVFSVSINNLQPTDFLITNGTMTSASFASSGTSYTFGVSTTGSTSGTSIDISLYDSSVQDNSGNWNLPATAQVDYNNTPGTATLSYHGPAYTNAPFDVRVTFSRSVTGLATTDFLASSSDVTITSVSGSGTSWIVTLTPNSGVDNSTTVELRNPTVSAKDEYNNAINGSNQVTVNFDTQSPNVYAYLTNPVAEINFDPFEVTLVFDEAGVTSFDMSKLESNILEFISISNGPTIVGATTEVIVWAKVKEDSPSGSQINVKVNAGAGKDKATNPNVATGLIYLEDWSTGGGGPGVPPGPGPGPYVPGPPVIFVDNVAPYVVSMLPGGEWAPIRGNLIITFNKTIDQSRMGKVWLEDFGYLGGGTWLDKRTLSFPYGYLKYYATYHVVVSDFYDLASNLQDPVFYGAFSTGMPVRPTMQREIMLFPGTGVELSLTPNTIHYAVSSQDFSFTVTALPGYNLDNLQVTTGVDLRDREGIVLTKNADGSVTVTIKNVTEPLFVTVTIGGVSNETLETVKVWAYDHSLNVQTDKLATLRIYTIDGQLLRNELIQEGLTNIPLPRGIYSVLVDSKVFKVVVQ